MAEEPNLKKIPRKRRTPETVRERAVKQTTKDNKPKKRIRSKIYRPFSVINKVSKKEVATVPVPRGKIGRMLGKRYNLIPRFFKEAWAELKLVVWPSRKDAARLTGAVIIFAFIFAIFVKFLDYGFEKLFKVILLN